MEELHPFIQLRKSIRKNALRQFRHNNDNSESMFHPEMGFVNAYDIPEVEAALANYEATLPTALQNDQATPSREEELIQMGSQICAVCPDPELRGFAQQVVAYFIGQQMETDGTIYSFTGDATITKGNPESDISIP